MMVLHIYLTTINFYYCPVNEFNRLCRTVLFPHKSLSRETDLFPAVANAVLDSELKLFRTLNSVPLLNAELTRNFLAK